MLANLVVMVFIARIGYEGVAAGAIISSSFTFFLVMVTNIFYAMAILVAKDFGAENYCNIGSIVNASILIGIIVATVAIFLQCYM